MSSLSRNNRRAHFARRTHTLGAGLALTLLSTAALADGAHRQFVFTAYADAAGGTQVLAGRYQAALAQLRGYRGVADPDPAAVETNRCVAYSMTLQWQKASSSCDAAVRAAEAERAMPTATWSWAPASSDDYVAVAYANRAVVHWLLKDDAGARKDLAKARSLLPQAGFVTRNVEAFEAHRLVAQAGTPTPKS